MPRERLYRIGPHLTSQLPNEFLGRSTGRRRMGLPLGRGRRRGTRRRPSGPRRGQQQEGVAGDGKGRLTFHGLRRPKLSLAHADDLFFVSMIDLDFPSPKVILKELIECQMGVGTDQEGRLSIEHLACLAEAIADRGDDQQTQRASSSALFPKDRSEGLDAEGVELSRGEGRSPPARGRCRPGARPPGWAPGGRIAVGIPPRVDLRGAGDGTTPHPFGCVRSGWFVRAGSSRRSGWCSFRRRSR